MAFYYKTQPVTTDKAGNETHPIDDIIEVFPDLVPIWVSPVDGSVVFMVGGTVKHDLIVSELTEADAVISTHLNWFKKRPQDIRPIQSLSPKLFDAHVKKLQGIEVAKNVADQFVEDLAVKVDNG